MTTIDATAQLARSTVRARRGTFFDDVSAIASRALRSIVREPEFVAPAIFMGLHVFVSFLQAFIFMLLTLIYVGSAVAHEH